jgi:hypothetical protein
MYVRLVQSAYRGRRASYCCSVIETCILLHLHERACPHARVRWPASDMLHLRILRGWKRGPLPCESESLSMCESALETLVRGI